MIAALFSGCKKYPENKLWFKKPETVFKGGKITMYTVNGVDHMPEVRAMYRDFPYNYFGKSIPDVFDLTFSYDSKSETLSSDIGEGGFNFTAKGKDVQIGFKPVNDGYGAQSIFVTPTNWKILKLTKSGQLKIQANIQYDVYVIQFN